MNSYSWLSQQVKFKNAIWILEEWYAIKLGFKLGKMAWDESWIYCFSTQRPRDRVPSGSMLALPDPRRPDRENPLTNFWWSLFLTAIAWPTCPGFPLDRQSTRSTMLRFQGTSWRDSVGRGQHSSNWVSGISIRTMHQSTTQSLSQTIWPRWASKQFLPPLYSTDVALCDFCLFPKLRGCHETIEEMKGALTMSLTRSHKRTSMGPSRSCWNSTSALQPEEITSKGTRVSCVYYQ